MPSSVILTPPERAILSDDHPNMGARMALSIVVEAARMLGARRLVPIVSAHIDGCLYHGTSGTLFCEKLVALGARTSVPTTTNVGALNLLDPKQARLKGEARRMAFRLMVAHEKLGCRPSWTCAPYQAGARPALGQQVAWGESNAVAFCNSVLGARTNRYGDFLDIACAISGRAPYYGLHIAENRHATLVMDISALPGPWQEDAAFFPVLGALVGRLAGAQVAAVTGLDPDVDDDRLKAFFAAAAATGAVGLVHLVGITPEAPTLAEALGGQSGATRIEVSTEMMITARATLSHAETGPIDAVALGSPHFSAQECRDLLALTKGARFRVPVYVCLARQTLASLHAEGTKAALADLGVQFVADTCVVVTPILPAASGVLMTNSAKFAHYAPGNTGYAPVFGSLAACVASAQSGRITRVGAGWA